MSVPAWVQELVLVSVQELVLVSVQELVLVPAWVQELELGRCLKFQLQGEARRQDPSHRCKAAGILSVVFRLLPLSEID